MNEYTIKISGNQVLDFVSFKVQSGFDYSENVDKSIEWDMISDTYTCHILCTEEQLVMIKLKYA